MSKIRFHPKEKGTRVEKYGKSVSHTGARCSRVLDMLRCSHPGFNLFILEDSHDAQILRVIVTTTFGSIYSAKGWFHPFLNTSCGVWSIEGQQFSASREPITKSRNDRVFVTESVVINLRMSAVHLKHEKPCRLLAEHTRILLKSIDHTTEEKTKERLEKTLFFSHFGLGSRVL